MTCLVTWTCKVLPFDGKPNVCNNQAYQKKLLETVQGYLAEQGVHELAKRYAAILLMPVGYGVTVSEQKSISVNVSCKINNKLESVTFDAKSIAIKDFNHQSDALKH